MKISSFLDLPSSKKVEKSFYKVEKNVLQYKSAGLQNALECLLDIGHY